MPLRKVVIELDEPTSDGDTAIELLSNLPTDVSSQAVADSYRSRWSIEGVFGELTLSLNGEINTLAYPPAAIVAYALALISFNVLTLVRSSVEVVHGKETADSTRTYHMAEEVTSTDQGMTIVIPLADWWKRFGRLEPPEMAEELKRMAMQVQIQLLLSLISQQFADSIAFRRVLSEQIEQPSLVIGIFVALQLQSLRFQHAEIDRSAGIALHAHQEVRIDPVSLPS